MFLFSSKIWNWTSKDVFPDQNKQINSNVNSKRFSFSFSLGENFWGKKTAWNWHEILTSRFELSRNFSRDFFNLYYGWKEYFFFLELWFCFVHDCFNILDLVLQLILGVSRRVYTQSTPHFTLSKICTFVFLISESSHQTVRAKTQRTRICDRPILLFKSYF